MMSSCKYFYQAAHLSRVGSAVYYSVPYSYMLSRNNTTAPLTTVSARSLIGVSA